MRSIYWFALAMVFCFSSSGYGQVTQTLSKDVTSLLHDPIAIDVSGKVFSGKQHSDYTSELTVVYPDGRVESKGYFPYALRGLTAQNGRLYGPAQTLATSPAQNYAVCIDFQGKILWQTDLGSTPVAKYPEAKHSLGGNTVFVLQLGDFSSPSRGIRLVSVDSTGKVLGSIENPSGSIYRADVSDSGTVYTLEIRNATPTLVERDPALNETWSLGFPKTTTTLPDGTVTEESYTFSELKAARDGFFTEQTHVISNGGNADHPASTKQIRSVLRFRGGKEVASVKLESGLTDIVLDQQGSVYLVQTLLTTPRYLHDLPPVVAKYDTDLRPIWDNRTYSYLPSGFMDTAGADTNGLLMFLKHPVDDHTSTWSLHRIGNSGDPQLNVSLSGQPIAAVMKRDLLISFDNAETSTYLDEFRVSNSAVADRYNVMPGRPITVPTSRGVLSNDLCTDQPLAALVQAPSHGKLTLESRGGLSYSPDAGFEGVDIAKYTLNGSGTPRVATIRFQVSNLKGIEVPDFITGGTEGLGKVTLSAPAPSFGYRVRLSRSNLGLSVPGSILVQPGARSATFKIGTNPVDRYAVTNITATGPEGAVQSATVVVTRATVKSVTVSPNALRSGELAHVVVNLEGAAGPSGCALEIFCDWLTLDANRSTTIAAGQSKLEFDAYAKSVDHKTSGSLIAQDIRSLTSKIGNFTIEPPPLKR